MVVQATETIEWVVDFGEKVAYTGTPGESEVRWHRIGGEHHDEAAAWAAARQHARLHVNPDRPEHWPSPQIYRVSRIETHTRHLPAVVAAQLLDESGIDPARPRTPLVRLAGGRVAGDRPADIAPPPVEWLTEHLDGAPKTMLTVEDAGSVFIPDGPA